VAQRSINQYANSWGTPQPPCQQ